MLNNVTSLCGECGQVELPSTSLKITMCAQDPSGMTFPRQYRFVCPSCKMIIAGTAADSVVENLVGKGVLFELYDMPVEKMRTFPASLPPFTEEDASDLAKYLDGKKWDWDLAFLDRGASPGA